MLAKHPPVNFVLGAAVPTNEHFGLAVADAGVGHPLLEGPLPRLLNHFLAVRHAKGVALESK